MNHLQQDGIIHIFAEYFELFAYMMESTKTYLVTGGSSGIGLAIADKLASWISGTTIPLDGGVTEENNLIRPKDKQ